MGRKIAGAQLPKEMLDQIPRRMGGVYLLYNKSGKTKVCFYVGVSENLRHRLKHHERDFDYFSYAQLSKKARGFIEPFLIAAFDAFPNEKMRVALHNIQHMSISPIIFEGTRELYWVKEVEN